MADAVVMEIRGLDALLSRLDKAPVQKLANEALTESTKVVHQRLSRYTQSYPPKPSGSTYIRTFTLRDSIQFTVKPFGASGEGRVYTALDYAPYVIGHESQVALHMGRWWTEKSVAEEMRPIVISYFSEAMDKVAQAIAGGGT